MPCGVHTLAGVPFDIRGVIDHPAAGIPVQRPALQLHFLQGATSLWLGPTNEQMVGGFVVHYADGERNDIPVVGGRHVRDWFILPNEPVTAVEAEVAWVGTNARSRDQGMRLRLFKRTWENPRPDVSIVRIDFEKAAYQGLFVLAITADDGHLASPLENPLIQAEIADATGQVERGLVAVEAALRGNPDNPRILELKARLLAGAKRHADAVELFTVLLARLDAASPESTTARKRLLRHRSVSLKESGRGAEALTDQLAALGIPERGMQVPAELLDLSPFYNAALTNAWHSGESGNDLATLPSGVQTLGGVCFDLRGIVQLAGDPTLKGAYPAAQTNFVVNRTFKRLHVLHATGWTVKPGTKIGAVRLKYAGGREHEFPIVFGEDVRDWNAGSDPSEVVSRARIAWRGHNAADYDIRLFLSTWVNPFPSEEVRSLDYVSAGSNCAPFLRHRELASGGCPQENGRKPPAKRCPHPLDIHGPTLRMLRLCVNGWATRKQIRRCFERRSVAR